MKKKVKKKPNVKKVCERCGVTFVKLTNRQLYCGSLTKELGCSWENTKELRHKPRYKHMKVGTSEYERKLFLNKRWRATRSGAEGGHKQGEWETLKTQYNWTCPCCKRSEPEVILTEDHIIPLSKGGSDNVENIQPLCKSCNCRKHTDIIKYDK